MTNGCGGQTAVAGADPCGHWKAELLITDATRTDNEYPNCETFHFQMPCSNPPTQAPIAHRTVGRFKITGSQTSRFAGPEAAAIH